MRERFFFIYSRVTPVKIAFISMQEPIRPEVFEVPLFLVPKHFQYIRKMILHFPYNIYFKERRNKSALL